MSVIAVRRAVLCATLFVCTATGLRAQDAKALSVDDVVMLLELTGPPPEVMAEVRAEMIRERCVSFPLSQGTLQRLRSKGADENLFSVIRAACYEGSELIVESQPTGAELWVGDTSFGVTPWSSRVSPREPVKITVRSQGRVRAQVVPLSPLMRTRIHFGITEDTVAVPQARSHAAVAVALGLEAKWSPRTVPPAQPNFHDSYPSGFTYIGMYLGIPAATTVGVAAFCSTAAEPCGLKYDGGAAVLGGGAVGLVGGIFLARWLYGKLERRGERRYNDAVERHNAWQQANDQARGTWIANHPDARRIVAAEHDARQRALAANLQTKTRNSHILPTRFSTEPLSKSSSHPVATTASAALSRFCVSFGGPDGRRDWSRVGTEWVEKYPDGRQTKFAFVGGTAPSGERGDIVAALPARTFEVFIPLTGPSGALWIREAGQAWRRGGPISPC